LYVFFSGSNYAKFKVAGFFKLQRSFKIQLTAITAITS